jgi:thiosulfate/3-mercaptopyruvate sulfurtransferase
VTGARGPLVTTEWLAQHLADPDLRIADASWYLPQAGRNPQGEYGIAHIPGAVFFDIEALSDRASSLPHMLARPEDFAKQMGALGIGSENFVVLYDGAGVYSAPRALWMLRAMGHDNAAVLDGGLPKWRREDRPVTAEPPRPAAAQFTARQRPDLVRDFAQLLANVSARGEQVVDARSPARFRGEEQEPRPGVRPGHIPGSTNVYYADTVSASGTMLSPDVLRRLFADRGIDLARPVITSCGSGITAAILSLALEIAGSRRHALYDGSWADWGARAEAPIATGAA